MYKLATTNSKYTCIMWNFAVANVLPVCNPLASEKTTSYIEVSKHSDSGLTSARLANNQYTHT